MTLALWINGNKRISIVKNLDGKGFIVMPSVFDGNQHQIIGARTFKTKVAAEQYVTKLIEIAKAVGTPGKYKEVKENN
jgi:hypothetical protein